MNRKQTYTIFQNDGTTYNEDISKASSGFEGKGVHFCIHVIYKDMVTITRQVKGPDGKSITTQEFKEFERPLLLGDDNGGDIKLGSDPSSHPDQVYLARVEQSTLDKLKGKTIIRVEIDDSIQLCCDDKFKSCSKVIPEWCREKFGDVPTFIFVHRSDRFNHNTGGKYAYDLRADKEDYHDVWTWDDAAPDSDLAHRPVIKVAPKYALEFRCDSVKCAKRKNRETYLVAVAHQKPTKSAKADAQAKLGNCPKCNLKDGWTSSDPEARLVKPKETIFA